MRTLKYKAENFNTNDANAICLELEQELGINLSNKNKDNPNIVHGYLNTSSDGDIEVFFYEDNDIATINALPEINTEKIKIGKQEFERTYKIKSDVPRAKCELADNILLSKCDKIFKARNIKYEAGIVRKNYFGS